MQTAKAFLNGRIIPADDLKIPVYDAGFMLGATVSEQLRTFGGKLYRVDEHLARLWRGLEIVGIDPDCTREELAESAEELAAANHEMLDPADDLGLSMFITPGPYATSAPAEAPRRATIGMSTYPLPFRLFAEKYEQGEHLVVSTVRQVSAESWPRELKCRSRMHYYLADQEVRSRVPGARALLLDEHGFVNETSTANVVGYGQSGFVSPLNSTVLNGISQAALPSIAGRTVPEQPWLEANLKPEEAARDCSELWLTSTPFCLLPVVKLDDAVIGDGVPGPMYKKLLAAWSEEVGVDIAAQARRFAVRSS